MDAPTSVTPSSFGEEADALMQQQFDFAAVPAHEPKPKSKPEHELERERERTSPPPSASASTPASGRFGRFTAVPAAQGFRRDWSARSEARSPNYTTRIAELPAVRA